MSNLTSIEIQELRREVAEIRQKRKEGRQKITYPSKLDPYRDRIVAMRQDGDSLSIIAEWLAQKNLTAVKSTIARALKRWLRDRNFAEDLGKSGIKTRSESHD